MDGCSRWLQRILSSCWRKKNLSCGSEPNGRNEEESDGVEGPLAILWDIENCCIPSGLSPEIVVDNTRKYLRRRGIKAPITLFSVYGDFSNRSSSWRESCQWSGVNLILVSNRKKDAADKAILVDMLLFAMDNPPPSSILLISGDLDFAAALHKLGQRGHSILVAATNLTQTSNALLSAAKFLWEWPQMASNGNFENQNQTLCGRFEPQLLRNGRDRTSLSNPDSSMQVSKGPNNCGLFAETASKPIPASLMQDSKLKQSGIDVVKEEILSLIHRKGGCITLGEIPVLYQHTFGKTISSKSYGCKLKTLLKKMGDDIHIHGEGNTACVYLISQGKCLCPQSNMNSDAPNHKNVTEAGCGLPAEIESVSNRTHKMQPSKIEVDDCGLPNQITTNPYLMSSL